MTVSVKTARYCSEASRISGLHSEAERFRMPSVEDAECGTRINVCIEAHFVLAVAQGDNNAYTLRSRIVVLDVKVQAVRHSQPPV